MTTVTPAVVRFPADSFHIEGGFQTTVALNATNTRIAFILTAKSAITVSGVSYRTSTVTTSQSIRVGLQSVTVNATTKVGSPSGTWLGATANGNVTRASLATGTTYEDTLTESVSLTAGQQYALVIEWASTTGSVLFMRSNIVQANTAIPFVGSTNQFHAAFTSGAWVPVVPTGPLTIGLLADGYWFDPGYSLPPSTITGTTFNSSSTPDERGNKLYLPSGTVCALWVYTDNDNDADLILYDASDNVLSSISLQSYGRHANTLHVHSIPVDVAVTEGWHRLALKPTSASNVSYGQNAYSANLENGFHMRAEACATSRTNAGAWTDTPNSLFYGGVLLAASIGTGGSTLIVIED